MALQKTDLLGSSYSSSDLAFLISLTTSRAPTFPPLFFRTHFSEERRSCRSAHSLFGNVVKELLLQHPMDFLSFSFLDLDGFLCVQLRRVCCWSSCVQTDAVHRQRAASRALPLVSTSLPRPSRSAQPHSTIFSSICLKLFVAHLVCPRTSPCSFRSPVAAMCQRHVGPCPKRILPSLMHCSCKKCLPMLNCLLYALMHAWVYCLSSSCAFSICFFVPLSLVVQ